MIETQKQTGEGKLKISEFVNKLEQAKNKLGDLEVKITPFAFNHKSYPIAYCDIENTYDLYDTVAWGEIRLRILLPENIKCFTKTK